MVFPPMFISIRSHIMIYKCLHCVTVQVDGVCVPFELMAKRYFVDMIDKGFVKFHAI